ncbi:hypothetical protein BJ170DRAFT_677709 [Xylariales sp. AK1849]|nr:hypothetical protein BJ170DRAFT_677709 [Xylariales sp. AK1849]
MPTADPDPRQSSTASSLFLKKSSKQENRHRDDASMMARCGSPRPEAQGPTREVCNIAITRNVRPTMEEDLLARGVGTVWGVSFYHELYLLVKECDFSSEEALHAATALTAKLFGWKDRGQIAQGFKADLILIEGNPLDDIDVTLNIRSVWRDGIQAKEFQK